MSLPVRGFETQETAERLITAGGGYEVVHAAPGVELGVYVLVAPEPDRQQPHEDDEVYVVLSGAGALTVGDERVPLAEGEAVFVEAGVPHRFGEYETLILLVVFTPPASEAAPLHRSASSS